MQFTQGVHIGDFIATKGGNPPAVVTAGTRTSAGINRLTLNSESCVLVGMTGAASGTPDSFTLDAKIQHSNDNGAADPWTDYTPPADSSPDGTTALGTMTAENTVTEKDVNLRGAKIYVRISETTAFVNGTAPSVIASTHLVLGTTQPPI